MNDEELIQKIYDASFEVRNNLSAGYFESVYQNALVYELRNRGINVISEALIPVYYKGILVGNYKADILVENRIIIELKACANLTAQHEAQLVNYLTATKINIGLLINFGDRYCFHRKVRNLATSRS